MKEVVMNEQHMVLKTQMDALTEAQDGGTPLPMLYPAVNMLPALAHAFGVEPDRLEAAVKAYEGAEEKKEKQPEMWGAPGDERLVWSDPDEVVEEMLDGMVAPLPEKITVIGFARMEAAKVEFLDPLEDILESLDEEYGDPDGNPTEPTEAMKEAQRVFLEVIAKEYVPWTCEEVCRKEIVVADWIKEHRPDWLAPGQQGEIVGGAR